VERLSFAYRDLDEINPRIVQRFGDTVKELDLSNNNIRDLSPLKGFVKLQILVLDGNNITSHTKIPLLPKLDTLWVNSNNISNLILFIDKLVENTPALKFLSMLKNEACPNFFNGHSLKDYTDYRRYVISRLPGLTCLDSTPITDSERQEGDRLYSPIVTPTIPASAPVIKTKDDTLTTNKSSDKDKKKRRNKKGHRPHKSGKASSATNNNLHGILPDIADGGKNNNVAPPPIPGLASNNNDSDFDDSSDGSSWTDEDSDNWDEDK